MDMKIIDDFLSEQEFKSLKDYLIYSGNLDWYTRIGVSDDGEQDGYFLMHMFYSQFRPCSDHFSSIHPLLRKIDPISIIRIKANFYPKTNTIEHHNYHVDFLDENGIPIHCKGCLFYLNTNNGKTIFENGVEVDSVENRALFFDPAIYHKSTTCTDDMIGRFNINFNYY